MSLAIPAFIACVFAFNRIGAESRAEMTPPREVFLGNITPAKSLSAPMQGASPKETKPVSADVIIERRLRIEGLLSNLDHVAAVAMQMKPEEADRLEPVIVDLAERTLELVDAEQLVQPSAEQELEDLETALSSLMEALTRQVQTEAVL